MENEKVLYSAIEAVFAKVTKRALNTVEMERLRVESRRMVQAIKSMAERQALEKCNKLNLATREAFHQVALDVKDLNERLDTLIGVLGEQSIRTFVQGPVEEPEVKPKRKTVRKKAVKRAK